jgi:hypothetical protein
MDIGAISFFVGGGEGGVNGAKCELEKINAQFSISEKMKYLC